MTLCPCLITECAQTVKSRRSVIELTVCECVDAHLGNVGTEREYPFSPLGHAAAGRVTARKKLPNLFFALLTHDAFKDPSRGRFDCNLTPWPGSLLRRLARNVVILISDVMLGSDALDAVNEKSWRTLVRLADQFKLVKPIPTIKP